jgi:uncharacterized glyoxalase superfamily protein PhnB
MGTHFQVHAISAFRVFVGDEAAARAFWADSLMLPVSFEYPGALGLKLGDADLIIEQQDPDDEEGQELIGRFLGVTISVTGLANAVETLATSGAKIVAQPERQPWGGLIAHVADPDGNVVTLIELER